MPDESSETELRDFLHRFRLAGPTNIEALAERAFDTADHEEKSSGARSVQGVSRALIEWRGFPPNVTFDPTGRCNVVCEMCDFHRVRSERGWKLRQMPELLPEVLRARLDEGFPVRDVTFSGGGAEFFVNKRWPELIEATKPHCREILIISNGTTLSEKIREQIVELQIHSIRVSLHGATAETAMEIMKGSHFEDVKQNLQELVRLRDQRGMEFPRLHVSFVGMRKNIHELPAFVRLVARLGADSVMLSSMMEREAEGMEHTLGQSLTGDPAILRREWTQAREVAEIEGIELLINDPYRNLLFDGAEALNIARPVPDIDSDDEPHSPAGPGQTKLCLFPFDKPFVGLNGSVGLCCSSTGRDVEMGNADHSSLAGVWFGPNYRALRESILSGENLPDFCARCPRAPNVSPKTMELHAALTHMRSTGGLLGLRVALGNWHWLRRYDRELAALSCQSVGLWEIVPAILRRAARAIGLRRFWRRRRGSASSRARAAEAPETGRTP
jgi:MoaA/NifB/PqqE/SkfB family radical SAM enzyme